MKTTTLHIKNMTCNCCMKVVNDELTKLNIEIKKIEPGKVEVTSDINESTLTEFKETLLEYDLELIDNKKNQITENIKSFILNRIHSGGEIPTEKNCSQVITSATGYEYSYVSNLFSQLEGVTIEKFIINQKIKRAQDMLIDDEESIKEIAFKLGYSSVQHFSNQFKKVTGETPSAFKKLNRNS